MTERQDLFADALHHHRAGRLGDAERRYRQSLAADPRHADALHLLGVIAHQRGQDDAAVTLIRKAIQLGGQVAAYHANLGTAFQGLGRLAEAVLAYRAAVCLAPDHADASYNLATALYRLGQAPGSVAAYGAALRCTPYHAEAHYNLGVALYGLGRPDQGAAAYAAALCLQPGMAEACANLGLALKDLGRLSAAVLVFGAALRLRPDYPEAWYNLGIALFETGEFKGAVAAYRVALLVAPGFAEAYANLGCALQEQGRPDQAVIAFDAALRVRPDYAEAYSNLGVALKDLGRFDAALAAYRAALRLKPDYADAHYNLGTALLLTGQFEAGWTGYEWRWHAKGFASPRRNFAQPQWRGEAIEGKVILLHAEQGMGDAIQFCRYAAMVAARGGRVILEARRPLVALFAGLQGVDHVLTAGETLPHFDLHCPLLSLPGLLRTRLDSIPPPIAFAPDSAREALWRNRLRSANRKIGIVWQGNPEHKKDRDRSVPLALFAPLTKLPGVDVFALQKGYGIEQIDSGAESLRLSRLGPAYDDGDFRETASVLAAFDLVITIDSAMAHLAGSLGVPVWVVLPLIPDWRWLLDRDDTPWYPGMRLFRQRARGDWESLFDRIALELQTITGDQTRP